MIEGPLYESETIPLDLDADLMSEELTGFPVQRFQPIAGIIYVFDCSELEHRAWLSPDPKLEGWPVLPSEEQVQKVGPSRVQAEGFLRYITVKRPTEITVSAYLVHGGV